MQVRNFRVLIRLGLRHQPTAISDNQAGEGLAALVRREYGAELRLFRKEKCFTPRAAADEACWYAVATWGSRGVRIATFTGDDF